MFARVCLILGMGASAFAIVPSDLAPAHERRANHASAPVADDATTTWANAEDGDWTNFAKWEEGRAPCKEDIALLNEFPDAGGAPKPYQVNLERGQHPVDTVLLAKGGVLHIPRGASLDFGADISCQAQTAAPTPSPTQPETDDPSAGSNNNGGGDNGGAPTPEPTGVVAVDIQTVRDITTQAAATTWDNSQLQDKDSATDAVEALEEAISELSDQLDQAVEDQQDAVDALTEAGDKLDIALKEEVEADALFEECNTSVPCDDLDQLLGFKQLAAENVETLRAAKGQALEALTATNQNLQTIEASYKTVKADKQLAEATISGDESAKDAAIKAQDDAKDAQDDLRDQILELREQLLALQACIIDPKPDCSEKENKLLVETNAVAGAAQNERGTSEDAAAGGGGGGLPIPAIAGAVVVLAILAVVYTKMSGSGGGSSEKNYDEGTRTFDNPMYDANPEDAGGAVADESAGLYDEPAFVGEGTVNDGYLEVGAEGLVGGDEPDAEALYDEAPIEDGDAAYADMADEEEPEGEDE